MLKFKKQNTQKTKFFACSVSSRRGFSFVELIITAAIMSLVFSGLFAGFQLMASLIGTSKGKAGALALMSEKMEYMRSLPYGSIGTLSGVPSGLVPQNSTTTLNGVLYTERVLVQYVDDPADGYGAADTNGILADYKQIKVEYTWTLRGKTDVASLVSNVVPPGIESTAGGGTIRVNVFDATSAPVLGAEVRFVNTTTTSTINTLRYTDLNGIAYLSGAPASANYEISATKSGYSYDGTYTISVSNPSPVTQPVAVVASQVTTMNFQIDRLGALNIATVSPPAFGSFTDTFTDMSLIDSMSSTTLSAGDVVLQDTAGVYDSSGIAQSTSTQPVPIDAWHWITFSATTSASTSVAVSVLYDNGGVMQMVPDADLAGNSVGFTSSPIDLSSLDVVTYPKISLRGTLATTDDSTTPTISQWGITHVVSQPVYPAVGVSVTSAKTIGLDAALSPIYKYATTGVTSIAGQWSDTTVEWDIYEIEVTSIGDVVHESCPSSPLALAPGVTENVLLTIGAATSHLLRVVVQALDGSSIANATVQLTNAGVDITKKTSLCGQTYFNEPGLYTSSDYTLTVTAAGFTQEIIASTSVQTNGVVNVTLN